MLNLTLVKLCQPLFYWLFFLPPKLDCYYLNGYLFSINKLLLFMLLLSFLLLINKYKIYLFA